MRRVAELSDRRAWQSVVIDGALQSYGMVSWKHLLTPEDAEDVRAFIAGEARKLADQSKAAK